MPAGFPSDIPLDAMSIDLLAMLERYDPAAARLFAQEAERQATTLEGHDSRRSKSGLALLRRQRGG